MLVEFALYVPSGINLAFRRGVLIDAFFVSTKEYPTHIDLIYPSPPSI
jgi:hypothetical protein